MRHPFVLIALFVTAPAFGQPGNLATWPQLLPRFESTGGGGWMIDGYDPVVIDTRCVTDFVAISPEGQVFQNEAEFDAVAVSDGVLCENGRWRAKDGSNIGTTPLRVFIRADGARFRSP